MAAEFDDGKDAGALRTIGEVGQALGIKPHVLRYWEQQFPMLRPLKRSGGRRYYRPEDVALVERIDRLVNREGYTLKGALAALKGGDREAAGKAPLARGETAPPPAELAARLRAVRDDLAAALSD
ncbi:MerR family transcriptional regulator [Pelagerythrobacter marinus]|uniref:MerR family transcriptional regulator n=1 Tax=Pelagerythrobacter marinus TaxID=538382 RepID=UPI0020372D7A|nr:MerR family transcriptional regulator [Pelagerythrobacter marinus]USA40062.1 MerR family transcriptional regulator [Pelagerythrobacter marinus]WPZ05816.1 MerR family transcriptional regulator [Pelagerythrobacter marinus]